MAKWFIIVFLLACLFVFMTVFSGDVMDYDPRWDEPPAEDKQEIDE